MSWFWWCFWSFLLLLGLWWGPLGPGMCNMDSQDMDDIGWSSRMGLDKSSESVRHDFIIELGSGLLIYHPTDRPTNIAIYTISCYESPCYPFFQYSISIQTTMHIELSIITFVTDLAKIMAKSRLPGKNSVSTCEGNPYFFHFQPKKLL